MYAFDIRQDPHNTVLIAPDIHDFSHSLSPQSSPPHGLPIPSKTIYSFEYPTIARRKTRKIVIRRYNCRVNSQRESALLFFHKSSVGVPPPQHTIERDLLLHGVSEGRHFYSESDKRCKPLFKNDKLWQGAERRPK